MCQMTGDALGTVLMFQVMEFPPASVFVLFLQQRVERHIKYCTNPIYQTTSEQVITPQVVSPTNT